MLLPKLRVVCQLFTFKRTYRRFSVDPEKADWGEEQPLIQNAIIEFYKLFLSSSLKQPYTVQIIVAASIGFRLRTKRNRIGVGNVFFHRKQIS